MNELKINGRFRLVCPEGFRELTEAEREKLNILGEGESLFLTNEEGHIAVSIGWKDVNAFAGFLLHLISPISSVEASVNRAMAPYGYRKETMLERQIGGQIAKGFRYTYTAGDTPIYPPPPGPAAPPASWTGRPAAAPRTPASPA